MFALPLEEVGLILPVVWQGPAARRLRLAVPDPHTEELVLRCALSLEARPGVESVRADQRTGRILVQYTPHASLLGQLVDLRERRGREGSASQQVHRPSVARAVPSVAAVGGEPVLWHALSPAGVLQRLGTRGEGLDERAAAERLARFGANQYEPYQAPGRWQILVRQFANLPTGLLLGFSLVELAVREWIDAFLIDAVVTMNAAIGYRIESKNEELLESWRRLEAGQARVLRDGMVRRIPALHLVPGDVLLCQAGDILPADARVIESHRLTANEAPLTGESEPQRKWPEPVAEGKPLAERTPMLYAGTALVSGRGRAVVTATGRATELAQVRALVDEARAPRTPLERRMEKLGRQATAFSIGAAGLTAAMGFAHGRPAGPVLRSAIALGVAAIPEGLPLVVTAAIVRCMRHMRSMDMVVRRMASVEALGGVTVICADKTGTLTANDMQLELLDVRGIRTVAHELRASAGDPFASPASLALIAAALSSDIDVHHGPNGLQVTGSSTERAFLAAAHSAGLDLPALRKAFPRLRLNERADGVHYVVSLHRSLERDSVAFIKGAPEQVLARCNRGLEGPLDGRARKDALARNEALAADGLRVLALGWQRLPAGAAVPQSGFTFIGLAGLRDPLRPGAADAVRDAVRADIRMLLLTGDQRTTAAAIARQVGLGGEARDGSEIVPRLDDGDAIELLRNVSVISRVTPRDKMRIIEALRERGEIVAMVGDGINDAAALKVADVGIAVGSHASGIARQTADIVMTSEDLRSILTAVGEGRIVQDNLRRTVRYLFSTNLSEILLVMAGAAFGREPLTPMQLLWINLLTDSLPALALALEPGEPHVLDRKPAPPEEPIVRADEWRRIWRDAALLAAFGGGALLAGGPAGAFAALPAAQLAYAALCRSDGARAGSRFGQILAASAAAHLAVCTLPGLRGVLKLPAPTPAVLLGFGAGIAWPWVLGKGGGEFVVKRQTGPATAGPSRRLR